MSRQSILRSRNQFARILVLLGNWNPASDDRHGHEDRYEVSVLLPLMHYLKIRKILKLDIQRQDAFACLFIGKRVK